MVTRTQVSRLCKVQLLFQYSSTEMCPPYFLVATLPHGWENRYHLFLVIVR